MGMELRMKRPEKFPGNPTPAVTWREFMELRTEVEATKPKGSRVVVVGRTIRDGELEGADSFNAVLDDLREEMAKHGEVTALVVPKPDAGGGAFDYSGGAVSVDKQGVGKCFVKFSSADVAKEAMISLAGRTFAGQELEVDAYDEARFDARDFYGA